jgi:hypothetical protein
MRLEIHKRNAQQADTRIDINEVFAVHYTPEQQELICEHEARALFDTLQLSLPPETKQAFLHLLKYNTL